MTLLLYLVTYASAVIFLLAVVVRARKFLNAPMHLRWELYPVAHEKEHLKHGGSFMEEFEWWKKPRSTSTANMLSRMIPEMLFIKALWEHNRPLWYRSFPFHFGLYLLIGYFAMLFVGVFTEMAGVSVEAASGSIFGTLVYYATLFFFVSGLVLAIIGTLGLLLRRLTDSDLMGYNNFAHIYNLIFFLVTLTVGTIAFLTVDRSFAMARGFVHSLVTFSIQPTGSWLVSLTAALTSLLIAYIPLTHMSHFFTKYFTYHSVLWDDEPNKRGSAIEKRLLEYLNYPVSWSAPHIKGDGKKTWADVAMEEIEK